MARVPSFNTRHGYGIVRIPAIGILGAGVLFAAFLRFEKDFSPLAPSMESSAHTVGSRETDEQSTSEIFGISSLIDFKIFSRCARDETLPERNAFRPSSFSSLSLSSVTRKRNSFTAETRDSASEKSTLTPGRAAYALAVASSLFALVLKSPFTETSSPVRTTVKPHSLAMSSRLSTLSVTIAIGSLLNFSDAAQ